MTRHRPILHLRSGQGLHGAERALLTLAGATPPPYEPIVCSLVRPGRPDPLGEAASAAGFQAIRIESRGRADRRSVRQVAERLTALNVQLIHAHDYKSLAIGLLSGRAAGVPVVATFHGDTGSTLALRLYEGLARALGNLTFGVAAASRPLAAKLRRWVRFAPVTFIANGLTPPAPLTPEEIASARAAFAIEDRQVTLAVVGRLSVEKGHRVLFEALKELPSPPRTLIAGDGPLAGWLAEAKGDLPIDRLGHVSDVRKIYAASDLVVLPSLTEGLPFVALEAMALGRCVVGSAVGELPSLLGDGAGMLVPPGDPPSLAKALQRLISDPDLRANLARSGQARVSERYGASSMARAYAEKLYAPALSRFDDQGVALSAEKGVGSPAEEAIQLE